VDEAKELAQSVFTEVQNAKNVSEAAKENLEKLEEQIKEFMVSLGATPNDIRTLAADVIFFLK